MARPQKYQEPTIQISVRLPERLVQKMDKSRGQLSRGDYIRRKLIRKVDWDRKPEPKKVTTPSGCEHKVRKRFSWGTLCTSCGARL